ncbi:MAG TPA: DEAD/DEAH box helicase [Candidatus Binatia bacterium]|nr:DEAD/DEAH box helicase [Candidatus Binatia bacterium]
MSTRFIDLGLPEDLADALAARGISEPFPIQAAAIPPILSGRDVSGQAPTGSGKTLAFGLPLVVRSERARPKRPRALVLAPTRELAAQIHDELAPLASARGVRLLAVYGGVNYPAQTGALARGVDVVIGCPGRLEDLVQRGALALADVGRVVVDEADRMADMGFLPAVRRLLRLTREKRQVVLFSATLTGDVGKLAREFQRDAVTHAVESQPVDLGKLRHAFWAVETGDRLGLARGLVAEAGSTIVFCRTRHRADRVARDLGRAGVCATAIHGGRSQGQRDRAMGAFASRSVQALVATDLAARGIHVDDVACVLHYDPPADAVTYVHRSGRTARAGARGVVVSFVGRDDVAATRRMQRALGLPAGVHAPDPAGLLRPAGATSETRARAVGDRRAEPPSRSWRPMAGVRAHGRRARERSRAGA